MFENYIKLKKLLKGVSRTFYLNIIFLRKPLNIYIMVAYLLCRIADTIEDDPNLNIKEKYLYLDKFYNLVCTISRHDKDNYSFLDKLTPTLNEKNVLENTDLIINTLYLFPSPIQNAIKKHLKIMINGMSKYASDSSTKGIIIKDIKDLEEYCYYVAGVVGEMVTSILIEEFSFLDISKKDIFKMGVNYGLGLQFANIIKDVYSDNQRGWHYYPQSLLDKYSLSHEELFQTKNISQAKKVISEMIEIAQKKLLDGLKYTLAIPRSEFTSRSFNFWPIILALKSLKEVSLHMDDLISGKRVKISRKDVWHSIVFSILFISSNTLIKTYYRFIEKQIKRYH